MSLPSNDYITGKQTSVVERENYALAQQQLAAGKAQSAEMSKLNQSSQATNAELSKLNKSSQLTNTKLQELNNTSQQIAKAQEELVRIQTIALDESNKQTSLLNSQLQIAKINELEKNRQNQIKQAAFSVDQQIISISEKSSNVEKYYLFKDQLNQIDIVQLTADAPNEISDKQYVREILKKLDDSIKDVKSNLSTEEIFDVDNYYINSTRLADSLDRKNDCVAQISSLIEPKLVSKLVLFLTSIFMPAFPLNEKQKPIALLIYYIAAFFTWGLILLLGLGVYATAKKKQDSDLASYKSAKESLEALLANLNTEIEKYSSLTQNFHKKYSI
jgi:hypothetical protein